MKFVIWGFVIIAMLYVLLKRPTALKHRNLSAVRINTLVDALCRRGFDGGTLTIYARDYSFSVTKRIHGVGDVRTYGVANLPERVTNEQRIQNSLEDLGLRCEETLEGTPTRRLLRIDFGDTIEAITDAIRIVSADGWHVDLEKEGFACLENVSEGNVSIGWKA